MNQVVDPRTKLLFLLFSNLFLFAHVTLPLEIGFLVFSWGLLLWQREAFFVGLTAILYTVVVLVGASLAPQNGVVAIWANFLFVMVQKFFPMLVIARLVTVTTPLGAWQEALQRLRCPQILITTVTMLLRFFPVLVKDIRQIWQALGFRGLRPNVRSFIRNPFQLVEYLFVPMLHTANYTAQEMSAAVLTRGMTVVGRKTSFRPIGFTWRDGVAVLVLFGFSLWMAKG